MSRVVVSTKVDREERALIELAAARAGVSACAWLRELVLRALPRVEQPAADAEPGR